MLVPPNLLYLPVGLKSLLFTRAFSRAWCTELLSGYAKQRPALCTHRVSPVLWQQVLECCWTCARSPLLSSLHAQSKEQRSHREGCHSGDAERCFLTFSTQTQQVSYSALWCPLCWKYPSAWTPSHMGMLCSLCVLHLSNLQLSRLRKVQREQQVVWR